MATLERVSYVPRSEISAKELERHSLRQRIEKSINILLDEQHSQSNLFPAATQDRHVDHYHDAWVRDNAMVGMGLFDPVVRSVYPKDTELGDRIRSAGVRLVGSMLELFDKEPWSSAFEQEPKEEKDEFKRSCKRLDQPAPPIHFKIDGENCDWPTQNQPDSWGEFLIVTATSLKSNELTLSPEQQATVDKIAQYLGRIDLPNFEHFSMWEWGGVHHPASLSTLAIVGQSLSAIHPFVSEKVKRTNMRTVHKLGEEVRKLYPEDYTVPDNHKGRSDMATLVAASSGALNGFFLSKYFNISHSELGNGQYPGKKRYLGDHYYRDYYRGDEESIWPMGAILEAKIFLDKAIDLRKQDPSSGLAEQFKRLGLKSLHKVQRLNDELGYTPELLQNRKEGLFPNDNHLLWNEALMVQASSRALVLV